MLKRSLIGLGIGLGALATCFILFVAGATSGGIVGYLSGRYAVRDHLPPPREQPVPGPPIWPEPPVPWWQRPEPRPLPHAPVPDALWGLVPAVRVTEVVPDGPADDAGVEMDDVIIAIEGIAPDTDNDVAELIRAHDPGDEIILTIVRPGKDTEVFELEVTLGRDRDDQGEMVTYLGIWYRPLGPAVRTLPRGPGSLN